MENNELGKVKVLGSGCAKCNQLEKATKEALKSLGMDTEIIHVTDFTEIAAYGVMTTPALVVDEKVLSYGKVLKTDEAIKLLKNEMEKAKKPKVAFVCVHNSCRSQIAEALGKKLGADVFESYSAGTETKPQINQDAVRLMKEIHGIDMELTQKSKILEDIPTVDIVITMGCNVNCPFLPCKHREDWGLDDPSGKSDEEFIKTIKTIEEKILKLKEDIKTGNIRI